jgi:hypothetical protein
MSNFNNLRPAIYDVIETLADLDFQKRAWIDRIGNEVSDYDEAINTFYDFLDPEGDENLLSKRIQDNSISYLESLKIRAIESKLKIHSSKQVDEFTINDLNSKPWKEIVSLSKEALKLMSRNDKFFSGDPFSAAMIEDLNAKLLNYCEEVRETTLYDKNNTYYEQMYALAYLTITIIEKKLDSTVLDKILNDIIELYNSDNEYIKTAVVLGFLSVYTHENNYTTLDITTALSFLSEPLLSEAKQEYL